MSLSQDDKKPNISLKDAYDKIRTWYQENIEVIKQGRKYGYESRSIELIKALPKADTLSDLEIQAVLAEIILGNLEWAYHKDDGNYKMAAYAHGALEAAGLPFSFSDEKKSQLKTSVLWKHLSISRYYDCS